MKRKNFKKCLFVHPVASAPQTQQFSAGIWTIGLGAFWLILSTNILQAQPILSALEQEISAVVKLAQPTVVTVISNTKGAEKSGGGLFEFFRDRQTREEKVKVGTGLIISSDGFVLTKESVIRNAERVELSLDDGSVYPAEWVMRDSALGIALLKILGNNLPHAMIGMKNDASAGSWITVIGNSLGVPHAVSVGVISAIQPDGMMQISANVDPGSNGSPVFNTKAEAIGIVAGRLGMAEKENDHGHYFASTALVYSLPELMPFVEAAIENYYAKIGWIGVTILSDSSSNGHPRILNLYEQGPGHQAGLQPGDIIMYFNGQAVTSSNRLRELVMQVTPGQEAPIKVLRMNQEHNLHVRVSQKTPIALQELAVSRKPESSPREFSPATLPQGSAANSLWLQRRLDALEKEVRTLQQNIYKKN